jgi:hypothetical protein
LHGDVLGELDHRPEAEPEQQDHGLWQEVKQQENKKEARYENETSQKIMGERKGKSSKWIMQVGSWVMVS